MIKINDKFVETIYYANGEFGIKNFEFNEIILKDFNVIIDWFVENPYEEIIQILFLKDYLNRLAKNVDQNIRLKFILKTNYLPFSREDKWNDKLNTYSLFSELFNFFDEIIVEDLHSLEKWPNIKIKPYKKHLFDLVENKSNDQLIVIFPDESSKARYYEEIKNRKNIYMFVTFKKVRDENGKIIKQNIKEIILNDEFKHEKYSFNGNLFYILDDICSYGNSFINAIKTFKNEFPKYNIIYSKVILLTTYDENQIKSDKFDKWIDEHYYKYKINFKERKN